MRYRQLPFYLLATGLFLGLILPLLIQDGMFMDGQIYACLAKNWAEGRADFWHPIFSLTWVKHGRLWFLEQPPLMFAMEGSLFKLLGSSIYTERIYSFLMACLTALFITQIWKSAFAEQLQWRKLAWLPLICWLLAPVVFWSYQNNMEENSMGMFVALAVWMIFRGSAAGGRGSAFFLLIAGFAICAAGLTKGLQRLFPLALPGILWLVWRRQGLVATIAHTGLLLFPILLAGLLIWLNPNSRSGMEVYLYERVFNSIAHVSTGEGRFYLLYRLFTELLIPLAMTVGMRAVWRMQNKGGCKEKESHRVALVFALLAAAGTFPLMITLEQRGFYLATALPYWALALAALSAPPLSVWVQRMKCAGRWHKLWLCAGVSLCIIAITATVLMCGRSKRNADMLHDVYLLAERFEEGSILNIPRQMWNEWGLQAYLIRHKFISLDPDVGKRQFLLVDRNIKYAVPSTYQKDTLSPLIRYELFRKKGSSR